MKASHPVQEDHHRLRHQLQGQDDHRTVQVDLVMHKVHEEVLHHNVIVKHSLCCLLLLNQLSECFALHLCVLDVGIQEHPRAQQDDAFTYSHGLQEHAKNKEQVHLGDFGQQQDRQDEPHEHGGQRQDYRAIQQAPESHEEGVHQEKQQKRPVVVKHGVVGHHEQQHERDDLSKQSQHPLGHSLPLVLQAMQQPELVEGSLRIREICAKTVLSFRLPEVRPVPH
mmetsp:Transcript_41288/g.109327  ORF Transcript_41288/g.109327 Transcript_41288/m.109327 type:complete len:224 (-) Transcript_41288:3877-4548(-)